MLFFCILYLNDFHLDWLPGNSGNYGGDYGVRHYQGGYNNQGYGGNRWNGPNRGGPSPQGRKQMPPEMMMDRLEYVAKQEANEAVKPRVERRDINWLYSNMELFKKMSDEQQKGVLNEVLESKLLASGVSLEHTEKIVKGKNIVDILMLLDNDELFKETLVSFGLAL